MKRVSTSLMFLLIVFSLVLIAFRPAGNDGGDKRQLADDTIYVREIRVTGVSDGFLEGRLEVEVHIYEQFTQDSARFLGCSGQLHGLEHVDVSDLRYVGLGAFFEKPAGGKLMLADVANKNIFLITSEAVYTNQISQGEFLFPAAGYYGLVGFGRFFGRSGVYLYQLRVVDPVKGGTGNLSAGAGQAFVQTRRMALVR